MCTMATSDNEASYTSYTSASEEIGSEDTPEELGGDELSSSSSTTTTTTTSSSASSHRRSPRLAEKRSRILEKEGVNFRPKRRRHGTGPPHMIIVPVASLPHPRAAGPPVPGGLFTHSPPHVPTVRIPVWPSPPPSSPSPSEASTSSMRKRKISEVESSSDSEEKRPRGLPPPPPRAPLPPQRRPPRQYPPPPLPPPTRQRYGPWRRINPIALFRNEPLFGPVWQPRYFDACPEALAFATSLQGPAKATAPRRTATGRGTSTPPPTTTTTSPLLPEYSPDSSRSGDSCQGRYSPSLPSSRGSSPASPTPSVSAGRTHRSGRFFPYLKPASSVAARRPPPAAATPPTAVATPPPVAATPPTVAATPPRAAATPPRAAATTPPPTTGPVTRSQTGSLPRTSAKRPLAEPTTTASKRLQKAWQLSDAEARDLSEWQKAAHHRFEVLQSVAAIDPARMSSRKRRRTEETNRPNLSLDKLMDTTDLLVSPTAFARLGRGVLAEVAPQQKYHFAGAALKVLQRAAEDMTISSLVVMYDFTKHRNAIELKKKGLKNVPPNL